MFEGIQRGLGEALKRLRGRGRITEANVRESLQEVRKALLDADVNYTVANAFIERVTERSIGQQVLRSQALHGAHVVGRNLAARRHHLHGACEGLALAISGSVIQN